MLGLEVEESLKKAVLEYLASLSKPVPGEEPLGDRQPLPLTISA